MRRIYRTRSNNPQTQVQQPANGSNNPNEFTPPQYVCKSDKAPAYNDTKVPHTRPARIIHQTITALPEHIYTLNSYATSENLYQDKDNLTKNTSYLKMIGFECREGVDRLGLVFLISLLIIIIYVRTVVGGAPGAVLRQITDFGQGVREASELEMTDKRDDQTSSEAPDRCRCCGVTCRAAPQCNCLQKHIMTRNSNERHYKYYNNNSAQYLRTTRTPRYRQGGYNYRNSYNPHRRDNYQDYQPFPNNANNRYSRPHPFLNNRNQPLNANRLNNQFNTHRRDKFRNPVFRNNTENYQPRLFNNSNQFNSYYRSPFGMPC